MLWIMNDGASLRWGCPSPDLCGFLPYDIIYCHKKGKAAMKLYAVGIGPGGEEFLTEQARTAIAKCDVIAGYELYIDLIKTLIVGKSVISTGMKHEVERCKAAIAAALAGKTVAVVCSGDAGVYGMAGLLFELAEDFPEVEVVVIAGITALCSAAAVLGAPLIHDFAVISLSDLLTPMAKIEKRLALAAEADFVICLYNPSSKKRGDYLARAVEIMLRHKSSDTPCGYVKKIGRDGESAAICALGELADREVDMFTTIIIGNSQTKIIRGKLVTPRGYKL